MTGTLIDGIWVEQENDAGWCQCSKMEAGPPSATNGCGRYFTGLSAFDKHMVREGTGEAWWRRCRSDDELTTVGLVRDRRGWWGEPE